MAILLLLLPLSIVLVGLAIYWFMWAVENKQFEDIDKHSLHALAEDEQGQKRHQTKEPIDERTH